MTTKTQARDMEALRLRTTGWGLEEIAHHFGVSSNTVALSLRRAVSVMARFAGNEQRLLELQKLDEAEAEVWKVLKMSHWVYTNRGDLVYDPEDKPMRDGRIILEAVDRLMKIAERRSKLMGLDAPVRAEILTIDSVDAEITRLETELAMIKTPGMANQISLELDTMKQQDQNPTP
jgi:hypothetical protein